MTSIANIVDENITTNITFYEIRLLAAINKLLYFEIYMNNSVNVTHLQLTEDKTLNRKVKG